MMLCLEKPAILILFTYCVLPIYLLRINQLQIMETARNNGVLITFEKEKPH